MNEDPLERVESLLNLELRPSLWRHEIYDDIGLENNIWWSTFIEMKYILNCRLELYPKAQSSHGESLFCERMNKRHNVIWVNYLCFSTILFSSKNAIFLLRQKKDMESKSWMQNVVSILQHLHIPLLQLQVQMQNQINYTRKAKLMTQSQYTCCESPPIDYSG